MSTKITFYSTSPPEESTSKYPKQSRTCFKFSDQEGDTEINFSKPVPVSARQRQVGFSPKTKVKKPTEPGEESGDTKVTDTDREVQKTRSGRLTKPPHRYEPVESVTDDFKDDEYDSGNSSD